VYRADTLELERILAGYSFLPSAVRFSPDGRHLICASLQGWVTYWNVDPWRLETSVLTRNPAFSTDIDFSPNGEDFIVTTHDGWLRRHSLKTGLLVGDVAAHEQWVNRIALSPDGKRLASGSDDRTVKIWDASSFELLSSFHRGGQVAAVEYSPLGKMLAIGGTELSFYPDLRDLVRGDGEEQYERAVKETGRRLDGFDLVAVGEGRTKSEREGKSYPNVGPREVRGMVMWRLEMGKAPPTDARVELLDTDTDEPLSPPVVGRPGDDTRLLLEIPDGVERFAARVTTGEGVTYRHYVGYRPGENHVLFPAVPRSSLSKLVAPLGARLESGKGVVVGDVSWYVPGQNYTGESVGCAEVSVENGARVYYFGPPEYTLYPDLDRTHPGAVSSSQFLVLNLDPGIHRFRARVGGKTAEASIRVHADAVTVQRITFTPDSHRVNPNPARCLEDFGSE